MSRITKRLVAVAAIAMTSVASANVSVNYVSDDVGSGLTRFTFTAISDMPSQLLGGFDVTFTASSMNQLNPYGLPTIFQDNNASLTTGGLDVNQDSQYLFESSTLVIASGSSGESSTQLKSAFVFPSGSPLPAQSITFAQIVVPNGMGNSIQWNGQVTIAYNTLYYNVSGQVVPEPATLALLGLGVAGLLRRDSRVG